MNAQPARMNASALELQELAELGAAYLQRWTDVRLIRWWARDRQHQGGDVNRALAIGMLCWRLQGIQPPPSPKLLQTNLAWRGRLLAEMLGPDPGEAALEEELL